MRTAPLLGRERETQIITQILADASRGGYALNVRGDAGIGKSSLLATAPPQVLEQGWIILSAQGTQAETSLAFAGLHQLLHPMLDRLDELPGPHRDAMSAAFGLSDHAAPDVFFVALATLDLLSEAAGEAPILMLVEDAQWLDRPTCDVLTFVARRLGSDPIVMLSAIRNGVPTPLTAAGIPELNVGGLEPTAASTLLDRHADGLPSAVRARLLAEAEGNPLALIELPSAFTRAQLDDLATLPSWLPLTERLEQLFSLQLADLPTATRQMLLLAAIAAGGAMTDVVAATEVIQGAADLNDLMPAVSAGLVEVDETHVRFRHPLIRSAVYQAGSQVERHAAHAALAHVLAEQPEQSIWHRAAAALGPDETLATDLVEAARKAQRRGRIDDAVAALERSADLTATPALRTHRLLQAAELVYDLGRTDALQRLLTLVDPPINDAQDQARSAWLNEMLAPPRLTDTARSALVDIADQARDAGDTELATKVLWVVAMKCWWAYAAEDEWAPVIAAIDRTDDGASPLRMLTVRAYATPLARAAGTIDRIVAAPVSEYDVEGLWLLGNAAAILGAFELASQLLARAAKVLRAQGRLGHLARVLALSAWADAHLGHWEPARLAAEEAGRLADESDQPIWRAGAHVASSVLAARRGETDMADSFATQAERIALPIGARFIMAIVRFARGITTLAAGKHADAYAQLRQLFDPTQRWYHPPTTFAALADLTEAALHSGNLGDVRVMVGATPVLHAATAAPWIRASMLYACPLLADDHDAEVAFQASLGPEIAAWPFHHARLQLAYGQWLRRQRRVAESRVPLRAARDAFDTLGAVPWSQHARHELRAAGEASPRRAPRGREQLTSQELQIAQMAADGLSNRDIAQQLFLSHRTVGSHLYRIFPKLGITSRGQLHAALDDTTPPVLPRW